MKRYTMSASYDSVLMFTEIRGIEDPDGEWVKYEDVRDLGAGLIDPGCNCDEMAMWVRKTHDPYWICPAHGYKKR